MDEKIWTSTWEPLLISLHHMPKLAEGEMASISTTCTLETSNGWQIEMRMEAMKSNLSSAEQASEGD